MTAERTQQATKSKKKTEAVKSEAKRQDKQGKVSNFDLVAQGVCPHDKASLGDEVAGKGVGITRTCSKCGHVWYFNRKIKTCACRTCVADKQKSKKGG